MLKTRIATAVGRFGIDAVPETSLPVLSGGQRTRAALLALIFLQPDFLILDEPTNHLDYQGRRAVIDLVANCWAGAIIVSHDRALLELMDGIVELTSLGATRFVGTWSQYRKRKARELAAAQKDLSEKRRQYSAKHAGRGQAQGAEGPDGQKKGRPEVICLGLRWED